jgi:hypothetical protein
MPGVSVPPPDVPIRDLVVDLNYPSDIGLQSQLANEGYRISWALESRVQRLVDLEGWEIVFVPKAGSLVRFRLKDPRDDLILVKKLANT